MRICRSNGARGFVDLIFYKYVTPLALGNMESE
jgi:hypothetical protein